MNESIDLITCEYEPITIPVQSNLTALCSRCVATALPSCRRALICVSFSVLPRASCSANRLWFDETSANKLDEVAQRDDPTEPILCFSLDASSRTIVSTEFSIAAEPT
jgi:hypothetical protein